MSVEPPPSHPYIDADTRITLIGAGTIGLSFAALHLPFLECSSQLTIYDTRADLAEHVASTLPKYMPTSRRNTAKKGRLREDDDDDNREGRAGGGYDLSAIRLTTSLADAVRDADIVQEQGPEKLPCKASIWAEVAQHARKPRALFWSSTSGITATAQAEAGRLAGREANEEDAAARLVVVHPYNPPHVMPLLEVVPGARTSEATVRRTVAFWRARGREPVVLHREVPGFVANRLAFALLREAVHLVREGVVGVEELDRVVRASMGPRWAVAGPFQSYHAGGGPGGLEAFFENIGGTVQRCWDDSGKENVGEGWEDGIFRQAEEAYGVVDTSRRDRLTRGVLEAARKQ